MEVTTAKAKQNGTYEVPEKVAIQIYKTKNYDQFYLMEGNRTINEKHVQQLIKSMTEEEAVSPIQVNERMEIIDGQHRYRALCHMKRPVYYYIIKGADLKSVQRLNSYSKNWNTEDYMESYIEAGNLNYIQYKGFRDMYKLPHTVNLMLLADAPLNRGTGKNYHTDEQKFKDGSFKIKDIDKAIDVAMKIEELAPFTSIYKARSFVYALMKCLKNKEFKWKQFVHKCSYQQKKLVRCSNVEQYMEIIEEVYNYNSKQTDKLLLRTVK
jgi:ParB-like nuclease domain